MSLSRRNAIAGLAVSLFSTLGVSAAVAQEVLVSPAPTQIRRGAPLEYQNTINERLDDAYFDNSRDYFNNRSFPRQVDWLIGTKGFTDNEINRDAREIHGVYREILARQMASGPIIRVFDLPTPFCQSLRTLPVPPNCFIEGCAAAGCPVGTQAVQPTYAPPIFDRVPPPQQPQRVPALW